ncbi:MAG: RNA polymerase, sigma-24 subunit, ECF subfamily [Parcubacteria group bacterium GW2011_GWA2_52_8]|nr:MAG: RNA polymerase, sigma-24 subunit, ECF subfamily [Parcubacteria group bacterium GW2011_GWA2_52_8]
MSKETKQSEAYLKAYDEYADAIYRYCLFRVFNEEKAKDLAQDTFLRTWEYLANGRQIENIRAFLYRVATNLIIDQSRKKREESLDVLQEQGFEPGFEELDRIEANMDSEQFLEILQELDEPSRLCLTLRDVEDLEPREIAEITGESANTVSVRIHRGIKKLKILIEHE